jgi:hypothetical protein
MHFFKAAQPALLCVSLFSPIWRCWLMEESWLQACQPHLSS